MKIAIPTDEKSMNSAVCVSFGRAPFFLFYDIDSKAEEYMANPAAEAQGGAGLKTAQLIVDSKAEALLTVRCGQNAADVLRAANIKVYKTVAATVAENLKAFAEGKLPLMTRFHAGFQGRQ